MSFTKIRDESSSVSLKNRGEDPAFSFFARWMDGKAVCVQG